MRWELGVLGNALILAGCASPNGRISHVHPHLTGAPGVGSLTAAEQAMTKAMQEKHANALVALAEILRPTRIEQAELKPMRRSNSVDSLSPKSRFLNAMNTIPINTGCAVQYNHRRSRARRFTEFQ
jgi:hypothetical protein